LHFIDEICFFELNILELSCLDDTLQLKFFSLLCFLHALTQFYNLLVLHLLKLGQRGLLPIPDFFKPFFFRILDVGAHLFSFCLLYQMFFSHFAWGEFAPCTEHILMRSI
jgi:hypothetical protein